MRLKNLSLINFKNLAQENISLDAGINCFVGDNGTCKTNIMDAIYYLSMCKSSLPMSDGQCIRHGEQFFIIDGEYVNEDGRCEQVSCSFARGSAKVMKRNGKVYERLSDHVGLIPIVIVSPTDSMLIYDAAEERRRYINGFISQLDKEYLQTMIRYNSALAERNKLLKMPSVNEQMLDIYDMQLSISGEKIYTRRREMIESLQPIVAEFYRMLSGDKEKVSLSYKSELNDHSFAELFVLSKERDMANGFTTSGVHRDDLSLHIGDMPLRKYGSQGQQKSFIISLKLAQYKIITERFGEAPILLLDDVFDKLDESRVAELIRVVAGDGFGQIIITDCNRERMKRLLEDAGCRYKIFDVTYGKIIQ